jgi:hypothetical protein
MSTSATRMRNLRSRRRSGLILLAIEADEDALIKALCEAQLLHPSFADDHDAITRATQQLIEIIAMEKSL